MRKVGVFFFIIIVLVVSIWYGINSKNKAVSSYNSFAQTVVSHVPPTDIPPTDIPLVSQKIFKKALEAPVLLKIPKINIQAIVESVGLDAKGNMDVPQKSENVAWYKLGYKPGEKGNAVMAGHLDKESGEPAVFWDLKNIDLGDKIITKAKNGEEYTFSVVKKINYPYNNFPLDEVFGPDDSAMLNLITCEGNWNAQTKLYSHRTVVYAKLDR